MLVALTGCAHTVIVEARETPVEAGLPLTFSEDFDARWDFGDGTVSAGTSVTHAFARPGHAQLRVLRGDTLWRTIELVVVPRAPLHLVPPDVSWALVGRQLDAGRTLAPTLQRLGAGSVLKQWLPVTPLGRWLLTLKDPSQAGVDPREGFALFRWASSDDATVTVAGVDDEARARAAFKTWLSAEGWFFVSSVLGLDRWEQDDRALDVFFDRGALYACESPLVGRLRGAQARIAAASARGLETRPEVSAVLDALPSGQLVWWADGAPGLHVDQLAGTVRLEGNDVHFEAKLVAARPLWAAPASPAGRLLGRAPPDPIGALAATIDPQQLAAFLVGAPGTQRRTMLAENLALDGAALDEALAGLVGSLDAAAWFDTVGFVRGTLRAGGRPQLAGVLLAELAVTNQTPVEHLVDALAARWGLRLEKRRSPALVQWSGPALGQKLELALAADRLSVTLGSGRVPAGAIDLSSALGERFEGAFGAGHLSLFVDVGALRSELLQPRLIDDVDPRSALTAQAIAVTVLDQLTQLDVATIDLSPEPDGAALHVLFKLRPPPPDDEEAEASQH